MLRLEQIPMRQDNYTYALIKDKSVIMIDPSEPNDSAQYFKNHPELTLAAIINTHSHIDHVGGNEVLWQNFRCPVYGPDLERDRIPHLSHPLNDRDNISLLGITITAHDVRAHTSGHMAFLVNEPVDEVVKHGHKREPFLATDLAKRRVMLVGDSLFAGGCGRLFEGTKLDLLNCLSFYQRQDPTILMACAHEYTKANLGFAAAMFQQNPRILHRLASIDALLTKEGATIPCPFALEQTTNPFLLALNEPERSELAKRFAINSEDLVSIVGALRKAKDEY